jgi:AraC-like DNA-binding protein
MDFRTDCFEDAYQHAASVRDWSQTYSQITPGSLKSTLSQVSSAGFQLFREHINQRVVQQGAAPRGRVCFAVPLAVPGAARVQGREADDSSVFVLREGEEFMFHMPQGTDMLSITFDRALFEEAVEHLPVFGVLRGLMKQPVIQVPAARMAAGRLRLIQLFEQSVAVAGRLPPGGLAERSLGHQMLAELVGLLTDPGCDPHQRPLSSTGSFIVERIHRMTVESASAPPSVLDVCDRLKVSRRTVQNSFQSVVETTPLNYMRSIRLNAVRRALMASPASELSIGDAAARWGFFHLSHFADDYHALFGELPSRTRRPVDELATR